MAPLLIAILLYIAVGVGLIRLSIWLTKRIPSPALRIAIHTAVFTLWFMPGFAASEGGAMPAPIWLIVLDAVKKNHPLDWTAVARMLGICWSAVWIVAFGLDCICNRWEKKQSADNGSKRLP